MTDPIREWPIITEALVLGHAEGTQALGQILEMIAFCIENDIVAIPILNLSIPGSVRANTVNRDIA